MKSIFALLPLLLVALPANARSVRNAQSACANGQSTNPNAACTGKANGVYPDPCSTTCIAYLNCWAGNSASQLCPSSSPVFSPTIKGCVFATDYTCPGGSVNSPPPASASPPPKAASPPPPVSSSPPPPKAASPPPPVSSSPPPPKAASPPPPISSSPPPPKAASPPPPASSTPPSPFSCVDSYPACPGWTGQCAVPGVATFCPCMCNGGPVSSPPPSSSLPPSPPLSPSPPPPPPTPSPPPRPPPIASPPPTPSATKILFSNYKDIGINMNWNTNIMSSKVTGSFLPVTQIMPDQILTWAFATGTCDAENWAGLTAAQVATNVPLFVSAGKKYIISTGGAAGSFTCTSDASFTAFVNRYMSANLIGIDFDIEAGQSASDVANLVARVKTALVTFPNLRFSFTIATLGGAGGGNMLGSAGTTVLQAIKAAGLSFSPKVLVNLMAMDYGSNSANNCVLVNGLCQMGQSAIAAAESLHNYWSVPYSSIELTPMIGGNDSTDETFTIADVATVSAYALAKNLGGVHTWSLDRDNDCAPGYASSTCNTYGQAGTLGFTKAFLQRLN